MRVFTAADAGRVVTWFHEYLAQRGVEPRPGSPFDDVAFQTWEHAEAILRGDSIRDLADSVGAAQLQRVISLVEIAYAVERVHTKRDAQRLQSLLELIGTVSGGHPGPEVGEVATSDSSGTAAADTGANKLFELLTACYAMHMGTDVAIDVKGDGLNPDVLITLDGVRWGFACKRLHSANAEGFASLLKSGAKQIYRSEAKAGTVVLSLRPQYQAEDFWTCKRESSSGSPVDEPWPTFEHFSLSVQTHAQLLLSRHIQQLGASNVAELLRGDRRMWGMHGVGYYTHVVGGIEDPGGPARLMSSRGFSYTPLVQLAQSEVRLETAGLSALGHAAYECFGAEIQVTEVVPNANQSE